MLSSPSAANNFNSISPPPIEVPRAPKIAPKSKGFLNSVFSLLKHGDSQNVDDSDAATNSFRFRFSRPSSSLGSVSKVLFSRGSGGLEEIASKRRPISRLFSNLRSKSNLSKSTFSNNNSLVEEVRGEDENPTLPFRTCSPSFQESDSYHTNSPPHPPPAPSLHEILSSVPSCTHQDPIKRFEPYTPSPVSENHRLEDVHMIAVLTDRLGSKDMALTVLRIGRMAEMWADGINNRLIQEQDENTLHRRDVCQLPLFAHTFYGEKMPKIPLEKYLARVIRCIDTFKEDDEDFKAMGLLCVLGSTILIDRFRVKNPQFELDKMNMHRMFMVATLVSFKVLDDESCSNEYFAGVAGVELGEVNQLEASFLCHLEFECNLCALDLERSIKSFCTGLQEQDLLSGLDL